MNTPAWNPKRPKVPVDNKGNWLAYPIYNSSWEEITEPFYENMRIDGMETGRSAKRVILSGPEGKKYPMFVVDLVKSIQEGTVGVGTDISETSTGVLSGWWFPSKRGANYGIRTVRREDYV